MKLRVRPAVPSDHNRLLELRVALWPDEDRDDLAAFLKSALEGRPESTLPLASFVAETESGALAGFIEVGLRSHANGGDSRRAVGFIEGWYVAEEARRRGVGGMLMRAAEEWSRAQGCTELASDTWLDAQLSEQAHLGVGFEVADRCIDFRKSLDGPAENPELDGRVHHHVISSFVERGFASTAAEIAAALSLDQVRVEASLRRLHDGHGLVLHPASSEVWIAHPFSSSPAGVFVRAGERGWWAPCLWCGMGIASLAAQPATLLAHYGGEDELARLELHAIEASPVVVHFATPPRDAWNNVVHWCATVQPFRRAEDVEAWCARHRVPRGVIVPLEQVLRLGRVWYGRHLAEDWKKWSLEEAQAIFESVGLTGEFWRLPTSPGTF
jgi:GNAT superfamily N-acetyltransferase